MDLYTLDDIAHQYNGRTVLSIAQWRIPQGSILGLAGPNGSGKSTLFKLLGFVERPTRGTILFQGRSAEPFSENVRGRVALLPQETFLLRRSVRGNVLYGLKLRNNAGDADRKVHEALEWVGLAPARFAGRAWFALSGGEARRVALAARLALRPQVLLLDEPTASVDDASAHRIREAVMLAHREWGTTLIIASHDMLWLQDICASVHHLLNGRLAGRGRLSFLSGPWLPFAEGGVYKLLDAQQIFVAATPPADPQTGVAAVEAAGLRLCAPGNPAPPGWRSLEGTLTRLNFDHPSSRLIATVAIGASSLEADLGPANAAHCRFVPGATVSLVYDPGSVWWGA